MLCKHDEVLFKQVLFSGYDDDGNESGPSRGSRRLCFISRVIFFVITVITLVNGARGSVEIEETPLPPPSPETFSTSINRPRSLSAMTEINNRREHQKKPEFPNFSTDYVRCFCNLPVCVSSGYMCKSGGGGCFSDVQDGTQSSSSSLGTSRAAASYRGRHGCLELITDKEQRAWCEKSNNSKPSTKKRQHPRSLFHCCYHDMCNHVDSRETRLLLNSSLFEETMKNIQDRQVSETQEDLLYTNSDVWFRAATIALPFCGLVIVIALVLLAVRLLQPESEDIPNHKLGMPSYILTPHDDLGNRRHNKIIRSPVKTSHHHNPIFSSHTEDYSGQSYLPLIIQKQDKNILETCCDSKNETHARLNMLHDNKALLPYPFYDSKEILEESDKYQKCNEYDYRENLNKNTENIVQSSGDLNCFNEVVIKKTYGKETIS